MSISGSFSFGDRTLQNIGTSEVAKPDSVNHLHINFTVGDDTSGVPHNVTSASGYEARADDVFHLIERDTSDAVWFDR
jgi:hypothetical protein